MMKLYYIVLAFMYQGQPAVEVMPYVYSDVTTCYQQINKEEANVKQLLEDKGIQYVGLLCESFDHIKITKEDDCGDCHGE